MSTYSLLQRSRSSLLLNTGEKDKKHEVRLVLSDLSPVSGNEWCAGGAEMLQAAGQGRPSVLQAPARVRQQPDAKDRLREAETKAKVVIN